MIDKYIHLLYDRIIQTFLCLAFAIKNLSIYLSTRHLVKGAFANVFLKTSFLHNVLLKNPVSRLVHCSFRNHRALPVWCVTLGRTAC